MHLHIRSRFVGRAARVKAAIAGVVIASAAVVTPFTLASGLPTASPPSAGTIHLFVVGTSSTASTFNVLITGAFADHGTTSSNSTTKAVLKLSKGTIKVNIAALNRVLNSPTFGKLYLKSCSFYGAAEAPIKIVSGTGGYSGIHATIPFKVTEGGISARRANGKCQNGRPAVLNFIGIGTGHASF